MWEPDKEGDLTRRSIERHRAPQTPSLEERLLDLIGERPPGGVVPVHLDFRTMDTSAVLQRLNISDPHMLSFGIGFQLSIDAMVAEKPALADARFSSSVFNLNDQAVGDPLALADLMFSGKYGKKFVTMAAYDQTGRAVALLPTNNPSIERLFVAVPVRLPERQVDAQDVSAQAFIAAVQRLSTARNYILLHHIRPNS